MKSKTLILLIIFVPLMIAGAIWAKGYYNDRYVASDVFYTQIPSDEVNEDSWLLDDKGVKQEKGKRYELMGYNEKGEERVVHFFKKGVAKDYFAPETYMKVTVSKTIELGQKVVSEADIPQGILKMIKEKGTKID